MDLATSATHCGLRPPVTWLAARRSSVDHRAPGPARASTARATREDTTRVLHRVLHFKKSFIQRCIGGTPPCEDGIAGIHAA